MESVGCTILHDYAEITLLLILALYKKIGKRIYITAWTIRL
jgi:hypothetical protein